jgi:tRNA nucleotidyltransferase (CCA-adding enzyme)
VDLITARSERYPRPGQLPVVKPGTFADDCLRRDFTVNTLALDLEAAADLCAGAGQCLVHHHPLALQDLGQGIMRVLHAGSFVDDPTRLFRAVRYEQRLGFRMSEQTMDLFRSAVAGNCPATVSGTRIRHEVELAFLESRVAAILNRLARLGLLAGMGLTGTRAEEGREACGRMSEADANRIGMGWLLLLGTAEADPGTVGQALDLPSRIRGRAEVFRSLLQDRVLAEGTLSDLALARRLGPVSRNELVLRSLQVYCPHLHTRIDQVMARAADPRPRLDGRDLIQLGYTPGRALGQVLEELWVLRLAGRLRSIEDERAWVREHGSKMQATAE